LHADCAIAMGVQESTFKSGGKMHVGKFRSTHCLIKIEGVWMVAASHWSLLR
jgi:hypothetical protein